MKRISQKWPILSVSEGFPIIPDVFHSIQSQDVVNLLSPILLL